MTLQLIKNVDYWVKRWQYSTLPVLGQSKAALASLLEQLPVDQLRPKQIAEVVLVDPIFTLQALRALNGMPRGRYAAPVVDVNNAALLLGTRRFIEQFSNFPDGDVFFPQGSALKEKLLAEHRRSRLAALIAWEWGRIRLDVRCEELHLAALLHRVQHCLILCDAALQHALKDQLAQAQELADWLSSTEADAIFSTLLLQWRFPEHLVDLAVRSRQHSPRSQCVRLAIRLADALCRIDAREDIAACLTETADALKVGEEKLWPLVRGAILKEARKYPLHGIDPVARHLILLPMPERHADQPDPRAPSAASAPARSTLTDRALAVFEALPDDATINEVFRALFYVLKQHLAMTRIVLMVPSTDRTRLQTRHVVGDERFRTLDVPLAGEHLLARLMGKTQTLWLHPGNGERLLPLLLPQQRALLSHAHWFGASLCVDQKPLALLIADRPASLQALDNEHYRVFQRLTADVARRLSRVAATA